MTYCRAFSLISVIATLPAGNESRSPDSVKFHSELMKLKQQYPDHILYTV